MPDLYDHGIMFSKILLVNGPWSNCCDIYITNPMGYAVWVKVDEVPRKRLIQSHDQNLWLAVS